MDNIALMMRLMTHVNVGATIALLLWLAVNTHSSAYAVASQHACVRPPAETAEGAAR